MLDELHLKFAQDLVQALPADDTGRPNEPPEPEEKQEITAEEAAREQKIEQETAAREQETEARKQRISALPAIIRFRDYDSKQTVKTMYEKYVD